MLSAVPSIGFVLFWNVIYQWLRKTQTFKFIKPTISLGFGKCVSAERTEENLNGTRTAVVNDETIFIKFWGIVNEYIRAFKWVGMLFAGHIGLGTHLFTAMNTHSI